MTLTPIISAATSDPDFKVGLCVNIAHNTSDSEYTEVTLTPCLAHFGKAIVVEQTAWDVSFVIDDDIKVFAYHGLHWTTNAVDKNYYLPNDDTAPGTVTNNGLEMQSGKWYQWGKSFTVNLRNNGQTHYVGVRLQCLYYEPAACPEPFGTFLTYNVSTPSYTITARPPTELKCTYNADHTALLFNWDWNDTVDRCKLFISEYDKDGNKLTEYESYTLYQKDLPFVRSTNYLHPDTAYIEWGLRCTSPTYHTAVSKTITTEVDVIPKVWKKIDGVWKKTIPWVKVNGVWLRATQAYNKTQSGWKTTIK